MGTSGRMVYRKTDLFEINVIKVFVLFFSFSFLGAVARYFNISPRQDDMAIIKSFLPNFGNFSFSTTDGGVLSIFIE